MTVHNIDDGIIGYGCSRNPAGIGDDPFMDDGLNTRGVHYHRRMHVSPSSDPQFIGRIHIANQDNGGEVSPEYASSADMIRIATARRDRYHYEIVVHDVSARPAGYTLSDLRIRFANMERQWRLNGNNYQFTGGTIFLNLEITVYVTDEARDKPRCRELIMRHEMMHVNDERVIASQTLPVRLPTLPYIMSDFRAPIASRDFNRRIRGDGNGHGSELEQAIQRNVWIPLSSNKASELHQNHPEHGNEIIRCLGRQTN